MTRALVALVLALSTLLLALPAAAQQPAAHRRRASRTIVLDPFVFEVHARRPEVFYSLQRANLGYELTEVRVTFVREVPRTVDGGPF